METSPHREQILGRGLYSVPEAARLIGVSPRKLLRWTAGYDFKGRSGELRFSEPVFAREFESRSGFVELSFIDLVEFLFVAHFLNEGVSLYTIRRAAESAAQLIGVKDHPFCLHKFKTDGKRIFADMVLDENQLKPGERSLLDLATRQHVFVDVVEPFLKSFDYDLDTERVSRWWPLGKGRQVVVDPAINFGAPVITKAGVPTEAIAQFANGRELAEVADWYEIPVQAVCDAMSLEHRLKAA